MGVDHKMRFAPHVEKKLLARRTISDKYKISIKMTGQSKLECNFEKESFRPHLIFRHKMYLEISVYS